MTGTPNKPYERVFIYWFSGTGNALAAARWVARRAEELGIPAATRAIDRVGKAALPAGEGRTLLGLHYPTHGFATPWLMIKFAWRFPRRRNAAVDVYFLNTRAGTKLSKLFFPGVSGTAIVVPMVMFWLKGYRVVGTKPLDMPSNWLQIHPGFTPRAAEAIAARCERQVYAFADRLLSGNTSYRGWWTLPVDLALVPLSVSYVLAGRLFLAKIQIAAWTCDGCGLCVALCPAGALKMKGGRPYWTFSCEACMRCINICPRKAVETAHAYAFGVIYAAAAIFAWLLTLAPWWSAVRGLPVLGWLLNLTAYTLASLPVIWFSYALLFVVLKWKPVNAAFVFTSLTKYYRRYLAPGVTAKGFITK